VFVVHVAFNEKAFIIPSELRCAQVRSSSSSSSSSPSALHRVFVSAPRTDPNTSNTCTCGNIMNGGWFLANSKAKSTLHSWNKLHKVLNFCQINSSLVRKHAFYLRATFACICEHFGQFLKSTAWWKYQTGCEYRHIWSIYYREQLITCSNDDTGELPYRARARMLWHFLSTNLAQSLVIEYKQDRVAFECHWGVAPLLTISALDIWTQRKCDWQPDTLNSLINFTLRNALQRNVWMDQ